MQIAVISRSKDSFKVVAGCKLRSEASVKFDVPEKLIGDQQKKRRYA